MKKDGQGKGNWGNAKFDEDGEKLAEEVEEGKEGETVKPKRKEAEEIKEEVELNEDDKFDGLTYDDYVKQKKEKSSLLQTKGKD